jgi:hypothetical protein
MFLDRPDRVARSAGECRRHKNPQRSVSNVARMYSRLQTPLGRGNRTSCFPLTADASLRYLELALRATTRLLGFLQAMLRCGTRPLR